jgi:hypothetical protein
MTSSSLALGFMCAAWRYDIFIVFNWVRKTLSIVSVPWSGSVITLHQHSFKFKEKP